MTRAERLKAQGLCTYCGVAPPRKNRRMCASCGRKVADATKRTHAKRRAEGKCPGCADGLVAVGRRLCADCLARATYHNREAKSAALRHYGRACAFCGEADERYLTLDHIYNDGAKARRNGEGSGNTLYRRLKTRGYPPGYQTLCWNCNAAKQFHRLDPATDPEVQLAAAGIV